MPPDRRPPDDPHEWLNRARSNLLRAKEDVRLPGAYLEDLCFDTQQAAEKAVKAVLLHRGVSFPYVHDLTALLSLLENHGESIPPNVRDAGRLTRFAIVSRYPGSAEPVTQEEYRNAVAIAQAVLQWAEAKLEVRAQ